ncbi:MAG TPA: hypothetical protein VFV34_22945 [Blastocatellia bacterium]|nr:hypothetical protein [Blastocatellia bacterium]
MEAINLTQVRIAAPCTAEWKWMLGDDRVRFCGQCNLYVYNLTALARDEAELLIRRNEGRLCVRFYRRKDGTILTRNCPIGLAAARKKLRRFTRAAVTLVLGFLANLGIVWVWAGLGAGPGGPPVMGTIALPVDGAITGNAVPVQPELLGKVIMGEVRPLVRPTGPHNPQKKNQR